jgi:hypothetical protein
MPNMLVQGVEMCDDGLSSPIHRSSLWSQKSHLMESSLAVSLSSSSVVTLIVPPFYPASIIVLFVIVNKGGVQLIETITKVERTG